MSVRAWAIGVSATVALVASLVAISTAAPGCDAAAPVDAAALTECVTVDGVRVHQRAFQAIADAHGGNRGAGSPGYDASAAYVVEQLEAAGLTVTTQEFEFPYFEIERESLASDGREFVAGTDFATMTFSGSGDVTGTAVPVDLQSPPAGTSTSGCEAQDFAGFPAGQVALIQRGTCPFGVKAANALDAGAAGAIIVNSGDTPENEGVLQGTLGEPVALPVVGTSSAAGEALRDETVSLAITTVGETRRTSNVLAEKPGSGDGVLMVGAHLDSVPEGPGINDNGSGSAAILEVARLMSKAETERTVRFAWWGAEELGLLGSEFYVSDLQADKPAELDRISAYLNFDMVGSPNFARFIYDGDDSDAVGAPAGPTGSAALEDVFQTFYTERGLTYEGTDFTGRSDYGPFIAQGVDIPSGGLFTGAEGVKTPAQFERYGGTAGVAFDPCYHLACDTVDDNSDVVLDQNSDAIAYATFTVASSLELAPNPAVADTPGDVGSGGGLHENHDHGAVSS